MWVLGEHKINKMALSLRRHQVASPLCLSDSKCALFSGVGRITEYRASKQQDDTATSQQAGYVTYCETQMKLCKINQLWKKEKVELFRFNQLEVDSVQFSNVSVLQNDSIMKQF